MAQAFFAAARVVFFLAGARAEDLAAGVFVWRSSFLP